MPTPSIVLSLRRIYLLPTRYGLWFGLILVVMLLGSMNYNNNMGFVLTFLLGSMTVVSILYTYWNLAGLRIEADKVEGVFAGEPCVFGLWFDNSRYAGRYALVLRRHPKDRQNLGFKPVTLDLTGGRRSRVTIEVPTQQRGRIHLGRIVLETRFPLGLFCAWSELKLPADGLVYPHPLGQHPMPAGTPRTGGQGLRQNARGDDFIGHRPYVVGDSPKHVDWKAVARDQPWLVKQFGGEGSASLWFTWEDVSAFRNAEAALSQLCRWVLQAESQELFYGLRIPGIELPPHNGPQHRLRCLEALALFGTH